MNIVSFGGGTNSAALLIGLYKHKIPIDLITFADTGAEHPHTYQFIEIINQWLAEHGMPQITVVQYVDRYGNRLSTETECLRSHTLPSIAYGHKRCCAETQNRTAGKVLQPLCALPRSMAARRESQPLYRL